MEQEIESSKPKTGAQEDILLAALKLFAEKGYFQTSLGDIAEASGASNVNGIYHFFKNKQAIAVSLYDNILDSLNVSIDDIRRKNPKVSDQLRGIVDLLFKLADEAPQILQLLLVINIHEILPEANPLLKTPPFVKILKIFQHGAKNNEIRSLAPELCFAYFFGIVFQTLRLALSGDLDRKVDTYQSQTWLAAWNTITKK